MLRKPWKMYLKSTSLQLFGQIINKRVMLNSNKINTSTETGVESWSSISMSTLIFDTRCSRLLVLLGLLQRCRHAQSVISPQPSSVYILTRKFIPHILVFLNFLLPVSLLHYTLKWSQIGQIALMVTESVLTLPRLPNLIKYPPISKVSKYWYRYAYTQLYLTP